MTRLRSRPWLRSTAGRCCSGRTARSKRKAKPRKVFEVFHDASFDKDRARQFFNSGVMDLRGLDRYQEHLARVRDGVASRVLDLVKSGDVDLGIGSPDLQISRLARRVVGEPDQLVAAEEDPTAGEKAPHDPAMSG